MLGDMSPLLYDMQKNNVNEAFEAFSTGKSNDVDSAKTDQEQKKP